MKKIKLLQIIVVVLSVVLAAQTGFAKAPKKEDWAHIFATEILKSKSKLGPQCLYESDKAYLAAKKSEKADKESQMSNAEFIQELQKTGINVGYYNVSQKYETQALCHLTQNEYLALRMYTGSYYTQINTALRTLDLKQIKAYRLVIKFLISGLNKLKDYRGVTKRGTSLKPEMITHCKADAAFADRGFLSTSVASGFGGQYRFILASQSCKYVAPFSSFPNEEEVLCLPGTVFQIRYMNIKPNGTEVVLQEAGQRFDLDDLIQTLEDQPELQNPDAKEFWAQSCQPEHVIFDKEANTEKD